MVIDASLKDQQWITSAGFTSLILPTTTMRIGLKGDGNDGDCNEEDVSKDDMIMLWAY